MQRPLVSKSNEEPGRTWIPLDHGLPRERLDATSRVALLRAESHSAFNPVDELNRFRPSLNRFRLDGCPS